MGDRQAKRQRRIDAAHERYTVTLLAIGMPPQVRQMQQKSKYGPITMSSEAEFNWNDNKWRENVEGFYQASFGTGTPPGRKARRRFIRGYVSWLRKEVDKRSLYEDYKHHGVTGRRLK